MHRLCRVLPNPICGSNGQEKSHSVDKLLTTCKCTCTVALAAQLVEHLPRTQCVVGLGVYLCPAFFISVHVNSVQSKLLCYHAYTVPMRTTVVGRLIVFQYERISSQRMPWRLYLLRKASQLIPSCSQRHTYTYMSMIVTRQSKGSIQSSQRAAMNGI